MAEAHSTPPLSAEYIAGFFDGEGCVAIEASWTKKRCQSVKTQLRVSVGNTNLEVIERIKASGYAGHVQRLKGQNQPVYCLILNSTRAVALLEAVRPFSIVKRAQIDVALEYWAFTRRPKVERGEMVSGHWTKTKATVETEMAFKARLHELKGRTSVRRVPDREGHRTANRGLFKNDALA